MTDYFQQALRMVTDEERAAVPMIGEGFTYAEGAEALGWPLMKFKRRFCSGRTKLCNLLPEYNGPEIEGRTVGEGAMSRIRLH